MSDHSARFGIYINIGEHKAIRISSTYWIPDDMTWIYLTDKVNATMKEIRELAEEKGLIANSGSITWGSLPMARN